MSSERMRYRQTLRAGRCCLAGGVGPQSQSAGGYAPSSRLASNPPTPGALIPYHESGSDLHFGGRRRGNSFFATYASWRLCVKSERAVRDKPRYSALFRLIGGVAPPGVRAIPAYSGINRDKPAYPGLSRDKKFFPR